MPGRCANPGCTANGTKRCARCKEVSYCSQSCQKKNWSVHKFKCVPKQPTTSNDDLVQCVLKQSTTTNDDLVQCVPKQSITTNDDLVQCVPKQSTTTNDDLVQSVPKPSTTTDDDLIQCVKIYARNDESCYERENGGRYETAYLPRSDPIFSSAPIPITQEFEDPLVIRRVQPGPPTGEANDNPHAAWLMINTVSGYPPIEWEEGVGSVFVARADCSPLTKRNLDGIVDYVSIILNNYGEYPTSTMAVKQFLNRTRLERFMKNYD